MVCDADHGLLECDATPCNYIPIIVLIVARASNLEIIIVFCDLRSFKKLLLPSDRLVTFR
jgi:hypothetical protein